MGIPELTSFLKRRFNWHPVNWKDWKHVIIDGNNVCYSLYKKTCTCLLGGEFVKFVRIIKEFFGREEFKGLHKIVIFDSGKLICDHSKDKIQQQKRIQLWKEMDDMQCQSEYDPYSYSNCLPLYTLGIFMRVLEEIRIEFHIDFHRASEGEADREIASLANSHHCPVLASDSDFFIYNLTHGFIHFDRYWEGKNAFYHIDKFRRQYSLNSYELCLLIPLVFGNNYQERTVEKRNYEKLLRTIANYQTCEEYILSNDNPAPTNITCKELQLVRDQYKCNLQSPIPLVTDPVVDKLPEWVKESLKVTIDCFPPQLISVYIKGSQMLPRVYEVIGKESAWKISTGIRQYLYAFMGSTEVIEVIRNDFWPTLSEEKVKPRNFKQCPVSIHDIESMDEQVKSDLVLTVLQGHQISEEDVELKFKPLPDKWKLPILAAFYWYRELHSSLDKDDLIKALLLSFLTCSQEIENDTKRLSLVREDKKSNHLEAIHAFAQWLCVYCDAIILNKFAREPFPTTSPACLYSGKVAMYYALASQHKQHWVDDFLHKDSPQYTLFNQFLYLVTETGRAGKHAPKPKESSYELPSSQHQARSRATPTQPQSVLQLSNRFATLSDLC